MRSLRTLAGTDSTARMDAAKARNLLTIGLVALAAGCASSGCCAKGPLAALEDRLIYYPDPYPEGDWQPPGLAVEDAWFNAADGTKLHGWFCPHPRPRAVVLLAHGNEGNVSLQADLLRLLHHRLGLAVMAFDYRGFGRSAGSPDEAGILQDARAARTWLAQRTGLAERDVVLMGRSLGGSVAIDLAAASGARGLIVESSFTTLPDVAAAKVRWLPVRRLMRTELDSLSKIASYRGPLLLSHGDADELVPFQQGEQLFAAAAGPKRFVRIPGGHHNDPQTEEYYAALDAFIAGLP